MITGKEAKLAWANGHEVQVLLEDRWTTISKHNVLGIFDLPLSFRLKPRTITLNGIEVPAPFEPKEGDAFYFLCSRVGKGYALVEKINSNCVVDQFGAWRTEDEIKQVVAALREVFK